MGYICCVAYILQNLCIFYTSFHASCPLETLPDVLWNVQLKSVNLLMGMKVEETYSYFVWTGIKEAVISGVLGCVRVQESFS